MLNLVRGSCKVVKIESHDLPKLINFISTQFEVAVQGTFSEERLNDIFAASQEGNVIILVTNEMKENLTAKDMTYLILLKVELDNLLSAFVNNRVQSPIINNIKLSPRLLIIRTVGNVEKVIRQVKKIFMAQLKRQNTFMTIHPQAQSSCSQTMPYINPLISYRLTNSVYIQPHLIMKYLDICVIRI